MNHEHQYEPVEQISPTHILMSCSSCGAEQEMELPEESWDWEEIERRNEYYHKMEEIEE